MKERKERRIIEGIKQQLEIIQKAVDNVSIALENCVKGEVEDCVKACMKVSMLENDSDTLRRQILEIISKSDAPPDIKADTSRLVRRLDHVVDWAQTLTRITRVLARRGTLSKISELGRKIMRMKEETTNCVEELIACLNAFFERNFGEARERADAVERIEEKIDDLYASVREDFPTAFDKLSIGEAVLLVQLIDSLEAISDRCEDAVDQVRVLLVK